MRDRLRTLILTPQNPLMPDPKDRHEVLHKISEAQSPRSAPDPAELTLQLQFTVLHVVGVVFITSLACRIALTLNPPNKAKTLEVAVLLLIFGVLCFGAGALIGRYTAIRGRWWEIFGKPPDH